MELRISFSKTGSDISVDYKLKSAVRAAISATLIHENFKYDADVSVTFTDNAHIRKLNKKYRNVDKHTDVLSFPLYEDGEFDESECAHGASLGDIVISLERAEEQAMELGNAYIYEVAFLSVHSTLHLLGYDHERSSEDDELQCRIQKKIMENLGVLEIFE